MDGLIRFLVIQKDKTCLVEVFVWSLFGRLYVSEKYVSRIQGCMHLYMYAIMYTIYIYMNQDYVYGKVSKWSTLWDVKIRQSNNRVLIYYGILQYIYIYIYINTFVTNQKLTDQWLFKSGYPKIGQTCRTTMDNPPDQISYNVLKILGLPCRIS